MSEPAARTSGSGALPPAVAPAAPASRPRHFGPADRLRAWLVTGALGRGVAFVVDFAAAVRTMLRSR